MPNLTAQAASNSILTYFTHLPTLILWSVPETIQQYGAKVTFDLISKAHIPQMHIFIMGEAKWLFKGIWILNLISQGHT